ncbi:ABC transporter ATP-binding protein [Streptomyces sp. 4503]|uniref:ABC transporter ATP-binding protein n=1 Tax=Streptomyces niphimycinicus TaxID=2842201 RepID=A0ABS6C819_9ACTN|nr:ABC transporter ATP-binding protein [Streptomyces niphimycinicus]MBU3863051.1 ABC transporter ATP-binding protein [Streptomyces niphimycinicus]
MNAPGPDTTLVDTLIDCREAARTYGRGENAVVAVHGATCQVRSGDRIAIMGPSGSGKSTLLHLMAGLERPTSGKIGWPALGRPATARDIGVVFQSPSLIPALDVVENAALPLVLSGTSESEARRRALSALDAVGVADLADKLPEELSGGQAQRVAVARVLALRPRVVLADEPTGALDRATGRHVVDVLLDTAAELGAALVVTTHDSTVGERLTERWPMHEGRLVATAPAPAASGPRTAPRARPNATRGETSETRGETS